MAGYRILPEESMRRLAFLALWMGLASAVALAQDRPTRFWNLTHGRLSEVYLAATGTTDWGPNQAKNDKDGVVDPDERLRITGIKSGTYDFKLTDLDGRSCMAKNVKVEVGQIFSIDEKDLTGCNK
jgi:hypothetical protein